MEALPTVRASVDQELRRRTLDHDRVLAAMLRIIDAAGLRVGNEVYAEENDSYGLSTLTKRHVRVQGSTMHFRFPAKSGKTAEVTLSDPGVARVLKLLLGQRGRWLFSVDGARIGSDEINARLAELTGAHLTAKDFRTWHGTTTAFRHLRAHLPAGDDAETHVLAAVDAARSRWATPAPSARAHYIHPDVIDGYTCGELERYLRRPPRERRAAADRGRAAAARLPGATRSSSGRGTSPRSEPPFTNSRGVARAAALWMTAGCPQIGGEVRKLSVGCR